MAAQRASDRRRRMVVGVLGLLLLAGVIGIALFAGGESEEKSEAGAAACGAEAPPKANPQTYDGPPEMALEEGVDYQAVIETSCGDIQVDLLEDEAPITVNNFVFLAQEGYYDGLTFHRVEPKQVIQGGAPEPGGMGGPGYQIKDELPESGKVYVFGTMAMANAGPNTAGSQFFFNMKDPDPEGGYKPSGYPPDYALFGEVDPEDESSVETLIQISEQETAGVDPATGAPSTEPLVPVYIETIEIVEA